MPASSALPICKGGRDGVLPGACQRQLGASLIVSLVMLTAVLLLGVSLAQIAMLEEKAARSDRDRQVAMQAAEAALDDAALDIESSVRSFLFADDTSEGFAVGCDSRQSELYLGLCRQETQGRAPVWQMVDFQGNGQNRSVPYGHFTGRRMQTGEGVLPARLPRYIIELMSYAGAERAAANSNSTRFYRITAVGFGMRESTQVALQVFYRKNGNAGGETIPPAGRFGWREISNWQEVIHARTSE